MRTADRTASGQGTIFWLRRPYFDLGLCPVTAPVVSHSPLLAYKNLDQACWLPIERTPGENFRLSLVAESGLNEYAIFSPLEVQDSSRTEEWWRLGDLVERYDILPRSTQPRVLALLTALGFHRLILKLVPSSTLGMIDDESSAAVAAARTFARYFIHIGELDQYEPTDFEEVIRRAPGGPTKYQAALLMTVYWAKFRKDAPTAALHRSIAEREIDTFRERVGDFDYKILLSRFYRGVSLVPFVNGDLKQMKRELDLAEDFARDADPKSSEQILIFRDNLSSVLETRMREALAERDVEQAEERIREAIEIDPYDPKLRIELAEVLFLLDRLDLAAQEYMSATLYSPPGTALAYYSAAYCWEKLGDPVQATGYYLAALRVDPFGISSLLGLRRTSKAIGQRVMYMWSEDRLNELTRQKALTSQELEALASTAS